MAPTIFSKLLNFLSRKAQQEYTQMEGADPSTRPTIQESLSSVETIHLTERPNCCEEEYKYHQDEEESTSPMNTSRFFPTRHVVPQDVDFFNRLKRMATLFPVRDISWIVAFSFTIGSAVFVANGFFLLLPLIAPFADFATETPYATPTSSVLGTLIFVIGGYAGYLEGLNLSRRKVPVNDGTDVEAAKYAEISAKLGDSPSKETGNKSDDSSQVERTDGSSLRASMSTIDLGDLKAQAAFLPPLLNEPAFVLAPTIDQLRNTYVASLLFHAGFFQFIGTIIFSMATITSLPGVLPSSPDSTLLIPLLNLLPASLGGLLFLFAACLQILSTQSEWYAPAPWKGDWQVGFWNAIGSLGFTLAGALPVIGTEEASQLAILADFWGSWAFLIGSLFQLFVVMKYYS